MRTRERIRKNVIALLGFWFVNILMRTLRTNKVQIDTGRNLCLTGNKVIYALWHSTILEVGYALRGLNLQGLVSQHRDGEYLAGAMELFGYGTVRGSTTRGGARAMIKLAGMAKKGHSIIITPDGPQGPRHVAQHGVIILAKKTGIPIIPVTAKVSRYWELPSWDRFVIPKPFAKMTITFGKPICVPSVIDETRLKEYCDILKRGLDRS